jgi:hypothetical protein
MTGGHLTIGNWHLAMVRPTRYRVVVLTSCHSELTQPVRWATDMNMRTGGYTGHGGAKREIRNSIGLEITNQSLPFEAVRLKRNIYCVSMIIAERIVRGALADGAGRKCTPKLT